MKGLAAFIKRVARATKLVVTHNKIPKPIRWLAAFGFLPIPGPFDELVLVLVAMILFGFYRTELRQAWNQAS